MSVDTVVAPSAHFVDDEWRRAIRRGEFASAWQISDAHLRALLARGGPDFSAPRHLQTIWTGKPLAQMRVLVRCYHGLGDTVQFIRFAAPLRVVAGEVIVWGQPTLLPLLRTAAGVDRLLPLHDGAPDVDYDLDVEIMELPHALRVDAMTIPRAVPYLFPRSVTRPFRTLPGELAVGLVWEAGDIDPRRSIPAAQMVFLAGVSGIRLFSLQRGRAAQDAGKISAEDISSPDAAIAAARLLHLDLVVTVDTFIAHLAGALGVPVWLLLHSDPDWRWPEQGTSCIWYPTMRVFRQTRPGDWRSVIDEVASALRREADTRNK